jgi:hypothetical protein
MMLVEMMAQGLWQRDRFQRLHDQCWRNAGDDGPDKKTVAFYASLIKNFTNSHNKALSSLLNLRKSQRVLKRFRPRA